MMRSMTSDYPLLDSTNESGLLQIVFQLDDPIELDTVQVYPSRAFSESRDESCVLKFAAMR